MCWLNVRYIMSLFLLTTTVNAHVVGVSKGEYRVDGENVSAVLVFARPELASSLPGLDADRDGLLSELEVAGGRKLINEAVIRQLAVKTDTGDCSGVLQKAALVEQDGLAIEALYQCHQAAGKRVFDFRFLEQLSFGHRHLATVTQGTINQHFVAYAGNASFSMTPSAAPVSGAATAWSCLLYTSRCV